MTEQIDTIRRAVEYMRPSRVGRIRRTADLLDQVAQRESKYRASEPHAGQPEPGDEVWLAWQIGLAWLGDELVEETHDD